MRRTIKKDTKDQIRIMVDAYGVDNVLDVIEEIQIGTGSSAWSRYEGDELPFGMDWKKLNGRIYVKERPTRKKGTAHRRSGEKVLHKAAPIGIPCIHCGSPNTYVQELCPSCKAARDGYKVRKLCRACGKQWLE